MEQAEKKLPEGLEEAAGEYAVDNAQYYYEDDDNAICSTADILKPAFIAGAEWQKAKMLEGAVEGKIAERVQGKLYARCQIPSTMGIEFGDKVRVIVIKED